MTPHDKYCQENDLSYTIDGRISYYCSLCGNKIADGDFSYVGISDYLQCDISVYLDKWLEHHREFECECTAVVEAELPNFRYIRV